MRGNVRSRACISDSWDHKIVGMGAVFTGHPPSKPAHSKDSETHSHLLGSSFFNWVQIFFPERQMKQIIYNIQSTREEIEAQGNHTASV